MSRLEKVACASSALAPVIWSDDSIADSTKLRDPAVNGAVAPTVLWIDDFEPGLALYKKMFEDRGFKVLTASSGETGVRLAALNRIDIVVTDYEMPGMDGLAVARSIKSLNPRTPVLLFSGSSLVPVRARRIVDGFCDKAGSRDHLLAAIHRLMQRKRSQSLQPPPVAEASDHGQRTVA